MKKKIIILSSLLLSLAACAAGEGNMTTTDSVEVVPDSIQQQDSLSEGESSGNAISVQLASLSKEVEELKETVNEKPGSSYGIFDMLISLLLGVAGGVGAFVFLEKRRSGNRNDSKEEFPSAIPPTIAKTSNNINSRSAQTQSKRQDKVASNNASVASSQKQRPSEIMDQKSDVTPPPAQTEYVQVASVNSQAENRNADVKKAAFGNISIPTKDLLIITEESLSDSEVGKNFEFTLNETRGTGTYTFAPNVEADAIDRLSALEPFIEPFEFNSSAKRVSIKRPGTLVNKGGYWQVETKIVITLS